jgi:hypothetical protein
MENIVAVDANHYFYSHVFYRSSSFILLILPAIKMAYEVRQKAKKKKQLK